jgi:tRNA acetyltransferase TAN1
MFKAPASQEQSIYPPYYPFVFAYLLDRYTHRLTPVSGSCVANIPELHSLCRRTIDAFSAQEKSEGSPVTRKASLQVLSPLMFSRLLQYKVELRVRNHNTLTRMEIIQEVAKCMPENYAVDLDNPEVFVLVEVFKVSGSYFGPDAF